MARDLNPENPRYPGGVNDAGVGADPNYSYVRIGNPEITALDAQKRLKEEELAAKAARDAAITARVNMGDPWADFYSQQALGRGNLSLPGMALGNQDQARTEQARVIQALQAQAAGNMNTLGQQQLAQGFQRAGQQQQSLGSSIRGTGGGAGLRAGTMGAADVQRGLAGEQQMLKLQEQQAAQAMLAQLMAQQHAQDVGLAGSMAQGALAGQGLNQEMERFYGSGLTGQMLSGYQSRADMERAKLGFDLDAQDLESRRAAQYAQAAATAAAAYSNYGNRQKSKQQTQQVSPEYNDAVAPILPEGQGYA